MNINRTFRKRRTDRAFSGIAVAILGVGCLISAGYGGEPAETQPARSSPALAGAKHSARTLKEGRRLYTAYCQSCHGDRHGKGTAAGAAPHNEKGHSWHHPDKQLMDWILNGKFGAPAMPKFKSDLTEEEVGAILAFIKTWWTPEQREMQADISQRFQR